MLTNKLFFTRAAKECKRMYDMMTEVKPKSVPEIPKIKPHSTSIRDRRSVKSVKPVVEPPAKPQVEEKAPPPKTDNYKTYPFDHTISSASPNDLPSEKSYSSEYSSMGGTPRYHNDTYPYSYSNR